MSEHRIAGWAGILFVIALAVQFALAPAPPDFDAAGVEIRDYLVDNRAGVLGQGLMQMLAMLFGVVFFAGLAYAVRSAGGGELLGRVILIASAALAATVLVGQAAFNAPLWIDGNANVMSDDLTRTFWSFAYLVFAAGAPVIALVAGATSFAGFQSKVVPAYVSWIGAIVVVAALAAFGMQLGSDLGAFGLANFLALMVFVLAASIGFIRQGRRDTIGESA